MGWSLLGNIKGATGPPGPAPSGTGLLSVSGGVLQTPALLVNTDVDPAAAIAESKLNLASDAAAGTASRRSLGTGATQACGGADSRLSNARTPTAHGSSHDLGGTDELPRLHAWTSISSFLNSWVNYGSPYANLRWMLDHDGFMHWMGCIKNGSVGSACVTMAAAYRPSSSCYLTCISTGAWARIYFGSNGDVIPSSPGTNASFFFDGICYPTD
jgi:hypothetical protein